MSSNKIHRLLWIFIALFSMHIDARESHRGTRVNTPAIRASAYASENSKLAPQAECIAGSDTIFCDGFEHSSSGSCANLGSVGSWQNITPPQVVLPGQAPCDYGTNAFAVDPHNRANILLGTCNQGIWKSADCGSTWSHINTGRNGDTMDCARQWAFIPDPVESGVFYANSGYGCRSAGLFKSVDSGVNWDEVWPGTQASNQNVVAYNFAGGLSMDPDNHLHLLLGFHAQCLGAYAGACLSESRDGGLTWQFIRGHPSWTGGEGTFAYILNGFGGTHWLFISQTNGLWRTSNSGATWTLVNSTWGAHGAGQLYRANDGTYYLGTASGLVRSTDGENWSIVPNTGSYVGGLVSDGTTMYTSSFAVCLNWASMNPYLSAPESNGLNWVQLPNAASVPFMQGGTLDIDRSRNILYSSNCQQGFWRRRL
jgi:hypothetical protein